MWTSVKEHPNSNLIKDFEFTDTQILRIDDENRYTLTGEDISAGKLSLPAYGCIEIKLWNLK
ncbi:MAG: hypothetical protein IJE40_01940 [Clostridia bacterium]|nr:hypothetical protein [Clostridia bacterium]